MSFWTVKVKVISEDIDTGKLRGKIETYLVKADSIEESQKLVHDYFKGTTLEYEVRGVGKNGFTAVIAQDHEALEAINT
jgi:hypothetical protein